MHFDKKNKILILGMSEGFDAYPYFGERDLYKKTLESQTVIEFSSYLKIKQGSLTGRILARIVNYLLRYSKIYKDRTGLFMRHCHPPSGDEVLKE